tara:strand:+ start:2157 stop:2732 length:576 start_codon:yes stop_codon:yes gene_type:complete
MATLNTTNIKHASSGSNNIVLAADGSTTISNLSGGVGKILQVVQVVHTATVSTTGITYTDTGLSASITPNSSSNKVLILVSQGYYITRSTDQARGGFRLLKGSTVLEQGPNAATGQEPNGLGKSTNLGGSTQVAGRYNLHYLDSPSTTSSTTYKTQFANAQSSASPTIYVNSGTGSGEMGSGFITLMEVAA